MLDAHVQYVDCAIYGYVLFVDLMLLHQPTQPLLQVSPCHDLSLVNPKFQEPCFSQLVQELTIERQEREETLLVGG
jgi:hypothetical protein